MFLRANVGIYRESQISSEKSNFGLYHPNNPLVWLFQKMISKKSPSALHLDNFTFNNTMACLYNACLIPQADCLHPVCFAAVPKRAQPARKPQLKTSVASQNKIPQVSKSQETASVASNFQDFESLECLNRNRSSFAKKQLEDYWCNLLIMFHSSNHDISAIKNV